MKRITAFELVDHGISTAQYFQGCGVAFTKYDQCVTGAGDTPAEAFEDMLEMIAQSSNDEIDTEQLEKDILLQVGLDKFPDGPSAYAEFIRQNERFTDENDYEDISGDCETYYYLSLRYNVEDDAEGQPQVEQTPADDSKIPL